MGIIRLLLSILLEICRSLPLCVHDDVDAVIPFLLVRVTAPFDNFMPDVVNALCVASVEGN